MIIKDHKENNSTTLKPNNVSILIIMKKADSIQIWTMKVIFLNKSPNLNLMFKIINIIKL